MTLLAFGHAKVEIKFYYYNTHTPTSRDLSLSLTKLFTAGIYMYFYILKVSPNKLTKFFVVVVVVVDIFVDYYL